jgi:hypothetical protein
MNRYKISEIVKKKCVDFAEWLKCQRIYVAVGKESNIWISSDFEYYTSEQLFDMFDNGKKI